MQFTPSADFAYLYTDKIWGKYLPRFVSVNENVNIFKTFEVMDMGLLWKDAHSNEDFNSEKKSFLKNWT